MPLTVMTGCSGLSEGKECSIGCLTSLFFAGYQWALEKLHCIDQRPCNHHPKLGRATLSLMAAVEHFGGLLSTHQAFAGPQLSSVRM